MSTWGMSFAQAAPAVAADIRDIRGPIVEAAPWWAGFEGVALVALIALVVAVFAAYAARALRRPKDARRIALSRIARAEARRSDAGGFAEELSEAVRAYLEARFGIHAPQRTTEELLEELAVGESSPLHRHRPALGAFLAQCDLAKFAGAALSSDDLDALSASARALVESSWREAAPPSPAAPSPLEAS